MEINTVVKPIEEFEVKLLSCIVYTQYVGYEDLPKFCSHCYLFGNYVENCKHCINDSGVKNGVHEDTVQVVKMTKAHLTKSDENMRKEQSQSLNLLDSQEVEVIQSSNPSPLSQKIGDSNPTPTSFDTDSHVPLMAQPELESLIQESATQSPKVIQEAVPFDDVLSDKNIGKPSNTVAQVSDRKECENPPAGQEVQDKGVESIAAEEGFQMVSRKRSNTKTSLAHQLVCSLPSANNPRFSYKAGLAKFVPVRGNQKGGSNNTKGKEMGSGGVPQKPLKRS